MMPNSYSTAEPAVYPRPARLVGSFHGSDSAPAAPPGASPNCRAARLTSLPGGLLDLVEADAAGPEFVGGGVEAQQGRLAVGQDAGDFLPDGPAWAFKVARAWESPGSASGDRWRSPLCPPSARGNRGAAR